MTKDMPDPMAEDKHGGLLDDSGGYPFLTTKSITGGKPLTAAMLEEAMEAMKEQPKQPMLVDKKTYDLFAKFERESKDYYNAQPWYRKLIYHWNMWRAK